MINIDNEISSALKSGDKIALKVFRLIKSEILKLKTAKNAKPYDGQAELALLKKMVKQRQDSIEQYKLGNRLDLVEEEQKELDIINKFLPEEPSEEKIQFFVNEAVSKGLNKIPDILKYVTGFLPNADKGIIVKLFNNGRK